MFAEGVTSDDITRKILESVPKDAAFGMPQTKIGIAARFDKFDKFGISNQLVADRKIVEINFVPDKFVVKAKFVTVVTDLVDSALYFDKTARCGFR